MSFVVAALYKFVSIPNYAEIAQPLEDFCQTQGAKGSLLLAYEGINGTIAASREGIDAVLEYLHKIPGLGDLEHKEALYEEIPFYRMKVRLKKEIVTIGIPEVSPVKKVGTYVEPEEWNDIIADPEVIVLDTRNDYEVEIGTFKGAIDPRTESFREFPEFVRKNLDPKKHKKVAMFCTGGIRCEKASSFMLEEGFEEVYHLKGGILKYLERIPEIETTWEGQCFVFDHRVSVGHGLVPGEYDLCHGCRDPIHEEDKKHEHYAEGLHCHRCYGTASEEVLESRKMRVKQILLAKEKGESHLGS